MGIFTAIIVLGVLVFVHELGHFLVARLCGVGVLEFAVGFGPVLARWQGEETTYSLRAIPLGGFVRMVGDDPSLVYGEEVVGKREAAGGASAIEGVQEELTPQQEHLLRDESKWFLKKSYLPRCAVVLAGPVANLVFAWVLAFASCLVVGVPTLQEGPAVLGAIQEGLPADTAGLKPGDTIVSVDGVEVSTFAKLVQFVRDSEGKALNLVVKRRIAPASGELAATDEGKHESLSITVKPLSDASPELDVAEGRPVNKTFRIGAVPPFVHAPAGLGTSASAATAQVIGVSIQTVRTLKALIVGDLKATRTIGGPIEIIKQTAKSAERGVAETLMMMIVLNVSLAIFNLLPVPVLDGGHLTFFTIEKLRGKPLTMRAQAAVMNVGLIILLSLMVFAVGNDIRRTFF
jgi:regulator of sigma E protease